MKHANQPSDPDRLTDVIHAKGEPVNDSQAPANPSKTTKDDRNHQSTAQGKSPAGNWTQQQ